MEQLASCFVCVVAHYKLLFFRKKPKKDSCEKKWRKNWSKRKGYCGRSFQSNKRWEACSRIQRDTAWFVYWSCIWSLGLCVADGRKSDVSRSRRQDGERQAAQGTWTFIFLSSLSVSSVVNFAQKWNDVNSGEGRVRKTTGQNTKTFGGKSQLHQHVKTEAERRKTRESNVSCTFWIEKRMKETVDASMHCLFWENRLLWIFHFVRVSRCKQGGSSDQRRDSDGKRKSSQTVGYAQVSVVVLG